MQSKRAPKSTAFLAALAVVGFAHGAKALLSVNTDVTVDTVWGDDPGEDTILLQQPIFVRSNATLTILPGVIVRGQPRTAAVQPGVVAGTPGTLIVSQDGTLIADGTALNPVIMTTGAVDNDGDGVCDDLDNNGFKDAYPGFDPSALPSLVPDATPTFCDDSPKTAPMAPLDKAGHQNVSLWGGLVLEGNAPINLADLAGAPGGYGLGLVEGLEVPGFPTTQTQFGGNDPHDSSGIIRYVSVRHAGDQIGADNELNGISLAGVGDGTVFDYVEVYANWDDCFESFGGTVNMTHVVGVFCGDDQFDQDEGFTGSNQFMFGMLPFFNQNDGSIYGAESGNKLGEWDGDDYDEVVGHNTNERINADNTVVDTTQWPFSASNNWNMTLIGAAPNPVHDFTPVSPNYPAGDQHGVQMRNGYAGSIADSIIVNTGSQPCVYVGGGGVPGHTVADNAVAGIRPWHLVQMASVTCADSAAIVDATMLTVKANGDALSAARGGDPNVELGATQILVNEDTTFDPTGDASNHLVPGLKTAPIDPRPSVVLTNGIPPRDNGLDAAASYRGAFEPNAPELWTTHWTVLNIAGLLAD